jgi:CheY-like chemotaxis protein
MLTASRQVDMASILVVDDHCDSAQSVARWLELFGHEVDTARDGIEAIEIARRQQPQYVLLDLGLPRLDGYEVALRLRQELAGPLVIIAITAFCREQDRRRAFEAGCDHYFLKPVDPYALISLLSPPKQRR